MRTGSLDRGRAGGLGLASAAPPSCFVPDLAHAHATLFAVLRLCSSKEANAKVRYSCDRRCYEYSGREVVSRLGRSRHVSGEKKKMRLQKPPIQVWSVQKANRGRILHKTQSRYRARESRLGSQKNFVQIERRSDQTNRLGVDKVVSNLLAQAISKKAPQSFGF